MLDYKIWREANSQTGNAVKTKPEIPDERQNNKFQSFHSRVDYGKSIEKQIFDSMVDCGFDLKPATTSEDMHDKIDGWWKRNGLGSPIQIKYRDTGDDILFEVLKDYKKNIPGRDMVSKAKYYAVLDKAGRRINIVNVDEAKSLIRKALQSVEKEGFDMNGNFRMGRLMLRVRNDPSSGQEKLMAFIPVSELKIIDSCEAKINF